jgi:PIN domain nuclease of toxin-antitoxin system
MATPDDYARTVALHESDGLGVSAISCWEVAKLVAGVACSTIEGALRR